MVQSVFELPPKQSDLEEFETRSIGSGGDSPRNSFGGGVGVDGKIPKFAVRETKLVKLLRFAALIILLGVATTICSLTYQYLQNCQLRRFDKATVDQRSRIIKAFETHSTRNMGLMRSFTKSITSYTMNQPNVTWPFVTLPDYERQARTIADLCYGVFSVTLIPLVEEKDREAFEEYAVTNQGWLNDGLSIQQDELIENYLHSGLDETSATTASFVPQIASRLTPGKITKVDTTNLSGGTSIVTDRGISLSGYYLPQWQISPAMLQSNQVLLNLRTHPSYYDSLQTLFEENEDSEEDLVMGRSFEFISNRDKDSSDSSDDDVTQGSILTPNTNTGGFNSASSGSGGSGVSTATDLRYESLRLFLPTWENLRTNEPYTNDPIYDIFVPIYDKYNEHSDDSTGSDSKPKVVGLVKFAVYWKTYLENVLVSESNEDSMDVVLENTCQQTYTYRVKGPNVKFLGVGDLHDPKYIEGFVSLSPRQDPDPSTTSSGGNSGNCVYSIRVYANQDMEGQFVTNEPLIFTIILILIFVLIIGLYVLYNIFVSKRQHVVMSTAIASSKIVSSLFPKNVRDRLYDTEGGAAGIPATPKTADTTGTPIHTGRSSPVAGAIKAQSNSNSGASSKGMIQSYLESSQSPSSMEEDDPSSKPIADSFSDCTVLFAGKFGEYGIDQNQCVHTIVVFLTHFVLILSFRFRYRYCWIY